MIKYEAHFITSVLLPYLSANPIGNALWEAKHTKGKDFLPFSAVEDHQVRWLHNARISAISYKISDDARGQKPSDGFSLEKSNAYIIIKYPDFFCFIDILDYEKEERTSTRRSLTSKRAREIACKIIL